MGTHTRLAATLAALSMIIAMPQAAHAAVPANNAAKLRQLDIMLMVSSLRCRFGGDNFQRDYEQFSTNQNETMQDAFKALQADYTATMGAAGAKKALDRMSVGMANAYGQGHPWLGCGELKRLTRELAVTADPATLAAVADELLADGPRGGAMLAVRR